MYPKELLALIIECGTFLQRTAPHPVYNPRNPPLATTPTKAFLQANE